jgi:hypothetical protein
MIVPINDAILSLSFLFDIVPDSHSQEEGVQFISAPLDGSRAIEDDHEKHHDPKYIMISHRQSGENE